MVSALDCCELARKQAGADGMRTRKSLLSRQGVFFVFVFFIVLLCWLLLKKEIHEVYLCLLLFCRGTSFQQ